jgi:Uma2 family endonuclease
MHRNAKADARVSQADFGLPRLEAGDRLNQPSFHRLYEAMPPQFKAELIEGVVIVPSPLRFEHGDIHSLMITWIGVFRAATPGVRTLDSATILLPPDNEPQPDATLIIESDRGGQTRVKDGYLVGAPELIIEVASSSASYDLHSKYQMYEKMGVREYVVAVVQEERVRWFVSASGDFVDLSPDKDGILCSPGFPGLWLDAQALWEGDAARLLDTLNRGLASPEHAAFVEKLQLQRGQDHLNLTSPPRADSI